MYLNSFDTSQWLPLEWTLSLSFFLSLHLPFISSISLSILFSPFLYRFVLRWSPFHTLAPLFLYSFSRFVILCLRLILSPLSLSLSLILFFSRLVILCLCSFSLPLLLSLSLSPSLIYSHFLSTFYIFSLYKSLNLFLFHFLSLYLP